MLGYFTRPQLPLRPLGGYPICALPGSVSQADYGANGSKKKEQNGSKKKRLHPIELALQWQWEIRMDPAHSPARIAVREGISRARVTQLMNLLHLPEQIQNKLQHPPAPLKLSSFSEHCLRQIVACGDPQSQVRHWQELLRECHILALI